MTETPIYQYRSSHQFLLDQVNRMQRSGTVSLRTLATRMDISHTLLVMLLQGKRSLRVKHAAALARGFDLSSQERMYLQALIQMENARDAEEKQICEMWLSELHSETPKRSRVLEEFELVSNWIHMAILSMCELHDFDPDPAAIARRLGSKVTSHEVRAAIGRLKSLGLIAMDDEENFKPTQAEVTTADDVANRGARTYHKQVMDLAKDALDQQALDKREFQSCTISLSRSKVRLAKEMIRKFRAQLIKAMESDSPEEVYQMSIQFFQLTESPALRKHAEDEGVDGTISKKSNHAGVMT